MPSATSAEAALLPLPRTGLPAWCDSFLSPPEAGGFFASRLWFDTLLAHALPPDVEPLGALCRVRGTPALFLPLLRHRGGRLGSLATVYSLDWRPLAAPGVDADAVTAAGRAIGRLLRFRAPARLDTLDPGAPGLAPLLGGLREAGLLQLRFQHFGNWHEVLARGTGWDAYLTARPSALRSTIRRKLARCEREMAFELIRDPGAALAAGIAAYEDVRARSWKPDEPFPAFDGALMRATAAAGLLRLGVLRERESGRPVAAQYWVLDQGGSRALLLKLAHDEASRAASPGTALTAMVVRALLDIDRVQELDLGVGDDPYKRLWVTERRQRIGIVLADPRHPAGLLEAARHLTGALARRARKLIGLGQA
jgi:hypothetical protein